MILNNDQIEVFEAKQGVQLVDRMVGTYGNLYLWSNRRAIYAGDVLHDLASGQPAGRIFDWIDEDTDRAIEGIDPSITYIAYIEYCNGLQK